MVVMDGDLMDPAELRRLAALGVEVEIARLNAIIDQLRATFPRVVTSEPLPARRKRRQKMTAAARRRISLRMKAHWRERRKEREA